MKMKFINVFADSYSTTHTPVWRKFKAGTILPSPNFNWGNVRAQAETSLSLLHKDQFTSFQQQ